MRAPIMPKRAPPPARIELWRLDPEFPVQVVDWRYEPGAHPPHHVHGAFELGWCRTGSGCFLIEDEAHPFGAGDVFAIGGAVAHAACAASDAASDWTFVFLDVAAILAGSGDPALVEAAQAAAARFKAGEVAATALVALVDEHRRRRPCWRDAERAHLVQILVACARREPARRRAANSLAHLRALEPALAWMAQAYASPPPLAAMARRCGLGPSQF